jgi:hypothetical protein
MKKMRAFAAILKPVESSCKPSCRICTAEVRGSNALGSTLMDMDTASVVKVV